MPPSGRSSKNWRVDREGKECKPRSLPLRIVRACARKAALIRGDYNPQESAQGTKITVIPVLQRFLHWLREATRYSQRDESALHTTTVGAARCQRSEGCREPDLANALSR